MHHDCSEFETELRHNRHKLNFTDDRREALGSFCRRTSFNCRLILIAMEGAFDRLDEAFAAAQGHLHAAKALPRLGETSAALSWLDASSSSSSSSPTHDEVLRDAPADEAALFETETTAEGVELRFIRCAVVAHNGASAEPVLDEFEVAADEAVQRARTVAANSARPPTISSLLGSLVAHTRPGTAHALAGAGTPQLLVGCSTTAADTEPPVAASRQERQLWRLARAVLCELRPVEAPQPHGVPTAALTSLAPGAGGFCATAAALPCDSAANDGLLLSSGHEFDGELAFLRTVMHWLQEGARDDAAGIVRWPPGGSENAAVDNFTRDVDMWAVTKARFTAEQQRAGGGGGGAVSGGFRGLDPDAPFRTTLLGESGDPLDGEIVLSQCWRPRYGGGTQQQQQQQQPSPSFPVAPEDWRRDADLSVSLWALMRSGQPALACTLAARYGQPWRAAVLAGGAVWQDVEEEEASEGAATAAGGGGPTAAAATASASARLLRRGDPNSAGVFRRAAAVYARVAAEAAAAGHSSAPSGGGAGAVPASPVSAALAADAALAWLSAQGAETDDGAAASAAADELPLPALLCTWDDFMWAGVLRAHATLQSEGVAALRRAQWRATHRLPWTPPPPPRGALTSSAAAAAPISPPSLAVFRAAQAATAATAAAAAAAVSTARPGDLATATAAHPYVRMVHALLLLGTAIARPSSSAGTLEAALRDVVHCVRDAVMGGGERSSSSSSSVVGASYARAAEANRGDRGGPFTLQSPDALLWPTVVQPVGAAGIPLLRFAAHLLLFLRSSANNSVLASAADASLSDTSHPASLAASRAYDDVLYAYARHLTAASGVLTRSQQQQAAVVSPLCGASLFVLMRLVEPARAVRALTAILVATPFCSAGLAAAPAAAVQSAVAHGGAHMSAGSLEDDIEGTGPVVQLHRAGISRSSSSSRRARYGVRGGAGTPRHALFSSVSLIMEESSGAGAALLWQVVVAAADASEAVLLRARREEGPEDGATSATVPGAPSPVLWVPQSSLAALSARSSSGWAGDYTRITHRGLAGSPSWPSATEAQTLPSYFTASATATATASPPLSFASEYLAAAGLSLLDVLRVTSVELLLACVGAGPRTCGAADDTHSAAAAAAAEGEEGEAGLPSADMLLLVLTGANAAARTCYALVVRAASHSGAGGHNQQRRLQQQPRAPRLDFASLVWLTCGLRPVSTSPSSSSTVSPLDDLLSAPVVPAFLLEDVEEVLSHVEPPPRSPSGSSRPRCSPALATVLSSAEAEWRCWRAFGAFAAALGDWEREIEVAPPLPPASAASRSGTTAPRGSTGSLDTGSGFASFGGGGTFPGGLFIVNSGGNTMMTAWERTAAANAARMHADLVVGRVGALSRASIAAVEAARSVLQAPWATLFTPLQQQQQQVRPSAAAGSRASGGHATGGEAAAATGWAADVTASISAAAAAASAAAAPDAASPFALLPAAAAPADGASARSAAAPLFSALTLCIESAVDIPCRTMGWIGAVQRPDDHAAASAAAAAESSLVSERCTACHERMRASLRDAAACLRALQVPVPEVRGVITAALDRAQQQR